MTSLTRWVLAHRRLVAGFWLAVTVIGIATAGAATRAMDQKGDVHREAFAADGAIARHYGGTGADGGAPLVPVVTLPAGARIDSPAVHRDLRSVESRLAGALPGGRIAGYASTGDRAFVSADGRTTFVLAYPRPDPTQEWGDNPMAAKRAGAALRGATVAGAPVRLTGFDALNVQAGASDGPGLLAEAIVGAVGALVVLVFVFGSLLALVPLLMALPAIMASFLAVYGVTAVTSVSSVVQFVIALIGLGVAIDYSLLIVVRWREERAHGGTGDEAIVRAMETAGRAVVLSGTTVAVGLLALVALPVPFLRSMGYGGMVIPLMSVAVALTLLPVVLHSFGSRLNWPHRRTDDLASAAWTRWARGVVRHRRIAAVGALAVLGGLLLAAGQMNAGIGKVDTLARSGEARAGLDALERAGIGNGVILPYEALVRRGEAATVARAIARVDGVRGAVAPASASWRRDGTAIVEVVPRTDGSNGDGRDLLAAVRGRARAAAPDAIVGGDVAEAVDFADAVYGNFPLMLGVLSAIAFVLLARAFRSIVLPAKAVLLNVVSVCAAWGALVVVWQQGHGSEAIWGIPATGSIASWIPLMVFAFLFGLSMDYEVFILSRIREEYDATGDTDEAVVRGIGRTGRLVTSAALILFLTFMSMASGPDTDVKVIATGLAFGILLDATIIRALLVPAAVSLFGRWNWALPHGVARLLRVAPSTAPRTRRSSPAPAPALQHDPRGA